MRIPALLLSSTVLLAAVPAFAQQVTASMPAPALGGAPLRHRRDAALEYALRARLGALPQVDLRAVDLRVVGTAVTLSGTVPSNAVRDRVLVAANTVDGVAFVRDELSVAPPPARGGGPGGDVVARARDLLAHDPGVVGAPQLSAEGGVLRVGGHVATYEDARRVLRTLQDVPGVAAVRSDLTVNETVVVPVRTARR